MQIKATVRCHLTPGTFLHCWWECSLVQLLWKTVWRFLRKLKIDLPYDPAIPLLGIYPEGTLIQKDTCTPMFTAALFTIAKTWKQTKCPLTDDWIKKMWYVCTMEYYSAIKKTKIMPFAATWMFLENVILSENSPPNDGTPSARGASPEQSPESVPLKQEQDEDAPPVTSLQCRAGGSGQGDQQEGEVKGRRSDRGKENRLCLQATCSCGFQKKTKWEAACLPTSRRTAKLQHQDGAALAESGRVSDPDPGARSPGEEVGRPSCRRGSSVPPPVNPGPRGHVCDATDGAGCEACVAPGLCPPRGGVSGLVPKTSVHTLAKGPRQLQLASLSKPGAHCPGSWFPTGTHISFAGLITALPLSIWCPEAGVLHCWAGTSRAARVAILQGHQSPWPRVQGSSLQPRRYPWWELQDQPRGEGLQQWRGGSVPVPQLPPGKAVPAPSPSRPAPWRTRGGLPPTQDPLPSLETLSERCWPTSLQPNVRLQPRGGGLSAWAQAERKCGLHFQSQLKDKYALGLPGRAPAHSGPHPSACSGGRGPPHFLPAALPDWVRLGQTGPDWAWLACWGLGLPIPSQAPPCPGHLTRPDPPRGTSAAHSLAPQPCRLSAPPPRVLGPPSCPGSPDPPHSSRTLLVGSHMPEFGRVPRNHGDQSLEGGSEPPAHLVTRPLHSCRVSHKHRSPSACPPPAPPAATHRTGRFRGGGRRAPPPRSQGLCRDRERVARASTAWGRWGDGAPPGRSQTPLSMPALLCLNPPPASSNVKARSALDGPSMLAPVTAERQQLPGQRPSLQDPPRPLGCLEDPRVPGGSEGADQVSGSVRVGRLVQSGIPWGGRGRRPSWGQVRVTGNGHLGPEIPQVLLGTTCPVPFSGPHPDLGVLPSMGEGPQLDTNVWEGLIAVWGHSPPGESRAGKRMPLDPTGPGGGLPCTPLVEGGHWGCSLHLIHHPSPTRPLPSLRAMESHAEGAQLRPAAGTGQGGGVSSLSHFPTGDTCRREPGRVWPLHSLGTSPQGSASQGPSFSSSWAMPSPDGRVVQPGWGQFPLEAEDGEKSPPGHRRRVHAQAGHTSPGLVTVSTEKSMCLSPTSLIQGEFRKKTSDDCKSEQRTQGDVQGGWVGRDTGAPCHANMRAQSHVPQRENVVLSEAVTWARPHLSSLESHGVNTPQRSPGAQTRGGGARSGDAAPIPGN
ncbi:LINE-1 retrotransposable element ORF2 protein [Camelus dromedarius]|uniref:LINE-1 retrotransposable element ORF2 protein n=1 Tax=Camelus dromedarius TaxID=9838 RepID=A0A5N4EGU4_CAMDR|nr:LINE-1 retrotransposable element ORF2 protein [Camelus dromedarius]